MMSILLWAGVLVLLALVAPLLRLLIAAVAGKQIGEHALARQPDQIHLQKAGPSAWKDAAAAGKTADALAARGFADAGIYTVAEMPGVVVQLLANARDGFYAAIYEHPRAGHWFDLVSRFQDGTSATYSTSRPTALEPRPGHPTLNLPGAEASPVLERALIMRPGRPLQVVSVQEALHAFEQGYAESMAYRKGVGISTREVTATAAHKVA